MTLNFGAIFLIGLVAASSSCLAVTGGLLLSVVTTFNDRNTGASRAARLRPVALFVLGRIIGYAVLGGLLGALGSVLTLSPTATAIITILAALYMIIMGLDMLKMAPRCLKIRLPQMPKFLGHKILDNEKHPHPLAPFVLGALTFFLPCGFTQSLQLYTLTTGTFTAGMMTMLPFALGTAPALLALGLATSFLQGSAGKRLFQIAAVVVVILGIFNLRNALVVLGVPVGFSSLVTESSTGVAMKNGTQIVKMTVAANGYTPNHFTVKSGVPVRWEILGTRSMGCSSVLVSRPLNLQKFLNDGQNIIEFIPSGVGEIPFSCSMGMYRGSFTIVK